jgi:uncharacterized RDD family membrane protein YckC
MNWYYAHGGQQKGPVDDNALAELSRTGVIHASTLVWHDALPDWQALSQAAPQLALSAAAPELGGVPIAPAQKDLYVQQIREGVVPGTGGLDYAGWWPRVGARILDQLILMVIMLVVLGILGGLLWASGMLEGFGEQGADAPPPAGLIILLIFYYALAFLGPIVYDAVLTAKGGATWGKRALGLKVVNADGSALTTGKCWGRAAAYLINSFTCGLSLLMPLFDEQKRGLHDYVCETRVVRA